MKFGHSYYTDDRKAPPEVVERLGREHPTLVLAWNNRHRCFDVLAETSKTGTWLERYAYILSWVLPCPTCGWRRWQKVNCGNHKVEPLSVKDERLFTRLREIRIGTTFEEADEWADKLDAADVARVQLMDKQHDARRLEGAARAAVNLPKDPRVAMMPRSVKDLVNQARKRVPISMARTGGR